MKELIDLCIVFLGIIGFWIAYYIYNKKKSKKKLICPLRGAHCEMVIHSDFSTIMGVNVEILGIFYYILIVLGYMTLVYFSISDFILDNILFGMSLSSVFFSLYLIFVQGFVIKKWCTWCVTSALISLFILVLSYAHNVL